MLEKILDKEGVKERQLLGDAYQNALKIKQLQRFLSKIGYDPGPIDGMGATKQEVLLKHFKMIMN